MIQLWDTGSKLGQLGWVWMTWTKHSSHFPSELHVNCKYSEVKLVLLSLCYWRFYYKIINFALITLFIFSLHTWHKSCLHVIKESLLCGVVYLIEVTTFVKLCSHQWTVLYSFVIICKDFFNLNFLQFSKCLFFLIFDF